MYLHWLAFFWMFCLNIWWPIVLKKKSLKVLDIPEIGYSSGKASWKIPGIPLYFYSGHPVSKDQNLSDQLSLYVIYFLFYWSCSYNPLLVILWLRVRHRQSELMWLSGSFQREQALFVSDFLSFHVTSPVSTSDET